MKELENIEEEIEPLENELKDNLEEIDKITKINLESVGNFYSEIREKIAERELILLQNIIEAKNTECQKFNDNIEKIKNVIDIIKNLKNVNTNTVTDLEFLNNSKLYYKNFKEILSLPTKPNNNITIIEVNREEEITKLKTELTILIGNDFEVLDNILGKKPEEKIPVPPKKESIIYPSFANLYIPKKSSTNNSSTANNTNMNSNTNTNNERKNSGNNNVGNVGTNKNKNKLQQARERNRKTSMTETNLIHLSSLNSRDSLPLPKGDDVDNNKDSKDYKENKVKASIGKVNIQLNKDNKELQTPSKKGSSKQNNKYVDKVAGEQETFTFVNKKNSDNNLVMTNQLAQAKERLKLFPALKSNYQTKYINLNR